MKLSEKQRQAETASFENEKISGRALFVVMNHALTEEQIEDAEHSLGVGKTIYMPEDLKKIWENILPDKPGIKHLLAPFDRWLEDAARKDDLALIQGDFGACYLMVNLVLAKGLVPVYATTKRAVVEIHQTDGSVRSERYFRHVRFRKYGE